ncbi:MAG: amidohydrolase family protein [Pseudomonadales bacterium]|jgi:imidazolonepropionase-like amidohydrolase
MSTTILTELSLWDGVERLSEDTLILRDTRIDAVCSRDALGPAESRQARALPGCTALPGMIDAHVHMVLDPNRSAPPGAGEHGDPAAMRERAARMVQAGITCARDLGGGGWLEVELRDAIDRGEVPGPRLLCAGQPVTSPGGHCHFWGGEAADVAAACSVIDRQRRHGVDLIKIMATGGRFTRGSRPLAPQFDTETLTRIVEHARAHDLPVAAHCHGTPGIEAAVLAGVHSIEHCSWVGEAGWATDYRPDVTLAMVERGTWVSPTINRGWQRMLDASTTTLTGMRAALIDMRAAGVPIMASTDAGIPGVFHHELAHALGVFAAVAELSTEETLAAATARAALGLGLGHSTGRLLPGFDADVLVVDGDPLADLTALTRPVAVWARGRRAR